MGERTEPLRIARTTAGRCRSATRVSAPSVVRAPRMRRERPAMGRNAPIISGKTATQGCKNWPAASFARASSSLFPVRSSIATKLSSDA